MDSDTVFQTWVDEELLFDEDGRPRIAGLNFGADFKPVLRVLNLQEDIDFMASQPMVLRRAHFASTRNFVAAQLGMQGKHFDEVFRELTHEVLRNETINNRGDEAASTRHLPCHQCVTGSYLWEYHQEEYSWHIMWRAPGRALLDQSRGSLVPASKTPLVEHLCPQLHVASHLGCWGKDGNCIDLKEGSAGVQGNQKYMMKSIELLNVAFCCAREAVLKSDSPEGATHENRLLKLGAIGRGGKGSSVSGETVCESLPEEEVLARGERWPRHQALLLGLGNVAFWRDENLGFCTSREELMEQWEQHTVRAVIDFFKQEP